MKDYQYVILKNLLENNNNYNVLWIRAYLYGLTVIPVIIWCSEMHKKYKKEKSESEILQENGKFEISSTCWIIKSGFPILFSLIFFANCKFQMHFLSIYFSIFSLSYCVSFLSLTISRLGSNSQNNIKLKQMTTSMKTKLWNSKTNENQQL